RVEVLLGRASRARPPTQTKGAPRKMGIEMKDTIYVETTIPSFCHEVRTEPEMVARCTWTRAWWELARARAELVTSAAVLRELVRGDYAARADCLALLGPLTLLAIDPDCWTSRRPTWRATSCPRTRAGMPFTRRSRPTTAATIW